MTANESVIVTDGEERAALAAVRSLGSKGYRVIVTSARSRSLAGASRFAARQVSLPSPVAAPIAYVERLALLVREEQAAVLLPVTEGSALAVLGASDAFKPAIIPMPPIETFRRLMDKAEVLSVSARLGLAVPRQVRLDHHDPAPATTLRFPVVVKPSRSIADAGLRRIKLSVRHAADSATLAAELAALPPEAFPVLVQERIVGPGIGVFLLRWDGRIVARFAHRRLREKPPSGGVSVYREAVAAPPELIARSEALLAAFDWQGVAMVEFKQDTRTETPYVMEVNGRLWGSLQLAVDAGVDFPRLLVECATGRQPDPVLTWKTGVRSRWWWGDVDQLLLRLRRSAAQLSLPEDAPSRGRALGDFLALWRPGDRSEVLRISDPGPGIRETLDWFRRR